MGATIQNRGLFFTLGALILGLVITFVGWQQARIAQHGRDVVRTQRFIQRTRQELRTRMESYENLLRTARGLLATGINPGAKEWEAFVASLDFRRLPGLKSLARVVVVPKTEISTFLEQGRQEGISYKIRRTFRLTGGSEDTHWIENAPDYYLIRYLVPSTLNPLGMGIDVGSSPVQRMAADQARDSGEATLTGKLIFTSNRDELSAVGFFIPVYQSGSVPETLEKRRKTCQGWISLGLLPDYIFQDLAKIGGDIIGMEALDVSAKQTSLLYKDPRLPADLHNGELGPFQEDVPLGGRIWRIRYHILPGFLSSPGRSSGLAWLLGGGLASILFAAAVFGLLGARDRAMALAHRMTIDLEEALQRFHSHVAHTPFAIIEWDLDGRIREWNPAAEQIFGYSFKAALRQGPEFLEPQGENGLSIGLKEALAGKANRRVLNLRGKDTCPVACVCHHTLVTDRAGGVTGILSLLEDQRELRKAEEALLLSQKLESLGVLAGGIAHDFNNMLMAISGNTELALKHAPSGPLRTHLDRILGTTRRAADLAQQMLAYAGRAPIVVGCIDLKHEVQDIAELLRASIPKIITIEMDLGPNPACISGDKAQIHQILVNLVTNAAEAIQDRPGTIHICISRVVVTEEVLTQIWTGHDLKVGPCVCLLVEDNGCGIEAEVLARIFDPFFTTKFTGRGLGLSAILGILKGHGGGLEVQSTPGSGTVFRLYFPEVEPAVAPPSELPEGQPICCLGTVLFADDEPFMRELAMEALGSYGYEVLLARDGLEAVEIYRLREDIQVVVLDLTMPRMGGLEAFRHIRKANPDARVILGSGYTEYDLQAAQDVQPDIFLHKPFRIQELCDAVGRLCQKTPIHYMKS